MRPQVFLEDRMKIVNTVGRVVVGSAFMMFGYEAAKEPGSRVQAVEALGVPQPELAVRLNGAAMIAGGAALATGVCARAGAAGLALSLLPTSVAGHPYWQESEESKRVPQRIHFQKNLALAGALAAYAFKK